MRKIDYDAANRDFRRDGVLVGVGSQNECFSGLSRRLEYTQTRRIRVLEDDVRAAPDLCERLLLSRAHVLPVSEVGRKHGDPGIHRTGACGKGGKALFYRWKLGTANYTQHVGFGQRTGNHTSKVGCVGKGELHPRDIGTAGRTGSRDEDGFGKIRADPSGSILKLEPMTEDEVVPL